MPFVRTAFWAALALSGAVLVVGGVATRTTTQAAPQVQQPEAANAMRNAPKAPAATGKDQTRYDYGAN